jgi:hypothetical protein
MVNNTMIMPKAPKPRSPPQSPPCLCGILYSSVAVNCCSLWSSELLQSLEQFGSWHSTADFVAVWEQLVCSNSAADSRIGSSISSASWSASGGGSPESPEPCTPTARFLVMLVSSWSSASATSSRPSAASICGVLGLYEAAHTPWLMH